MQWGKCYITVCARYSSKCNLSNASLPHGYEYVFFVKCRCRDRDMYKRSWSFRVLTHCLQQYWTPRDNSVFIRGQKVSITKSTWKEHGLGYKMYFSLHQPFSYCHKSSTVFNLSLRLGRVPVKPVGQFICSGICMMSQRL